MKKVRIITLAGLGIISLIIIIISFFQQSILLSKKQTTITKAEECGCPGGCCDDACDDPNPPPECDNFCASHPDDCPPPPVNPTNGVRPTDIPGNRSCGTRCTENCSPGGCSNGPCVWYGNGDCRRGCNCSGQSTSSYTCSPCGNNCPANPPQTGVASCSRNVCSPRGCVQYKCSTVNYVPGPGGCNLSNECGSDPDCQSCGNPPPTTIPPSPTPIPPTATPTPIPPTSVITPPPANSLSNRAGTPSRPTQSWTCLDADFCAKSQNCSKIPGVNYVHRVRLKNNSNSQLQANTRTYIFECLELTTGYKCTSGSPSIDNEIIGANYLPTLSQTFGYQFIKLTATDGSTVINQPQNTGAAGIFGPFEWESTTTNNIGRTFFAVQNIAGSDSPDAVGALHQGTVTFAGKGGQKCLLIKYDPHGIILDETTKQPINNATITLFQKNDQNKFIAVTAKDLIGGIINPLFSDNNGNFAFMVPDGTYQIKVEKIGYRTYLSPAIIQKGKSEYVEVILQRLSLFEKISQFISKHHL